MVVRVVAAVVIGMIVIGMMLSNGVSPAAAGTDGARGRDAAVFTITLTFVDPSRSTPATPGSPAAPQRVITTKIRYPTAGQQPAPLVVLIHGRNGDPEQVDDLATAWAAAGFVVAVPKLPRANADRTGKPRQIEVAEFPRDVSFVIDQLLRLDAAPAPNPLRGRIDAHEIGVGGISLGGMTAYGLVSNTCCIDRRVKAAILMAAVRPDFPHGTYRRQRVPVMLVHGDLDRGYHWSVETYPELAAPKWFVTLHGAPHGPPFEDEPSKHDALVQTITIDFWDRYLKMEHAAGRQLVNTVTRSDGQATLRRDVAVASTQR
jgi:dienelactone hydrolase